MKLLKENQTEEYEDLAQELGDVGVSLTCAVKVSYVNFNKPFQHLWTFLL